MVKATTELRANWVAHDSIQTAVGRYSMIRKMMDARMNTAFVETPPIGDSYGEGDMDAFFSFLNEAKSSGFVVFAWISNHKRTYPVPADLRLEDERKAQAQWVEDIIKGAPCIDGIAIDYIRYPTWEVSDGEKIEGVSLTIQAIRKVTDQRSVSLLSTSFPAATVTYRGVDSSWDGDVPAWFQDWYAANPQNYFKVEASSGGTGMVNQGNLNGSNPAFLLGPSFMSYQQDPISWIENGFVDHVVPMQYTADPAVMRNDIDVWESFTGWIGHNMTSIYLGLGWMDEPSSFPDSQFDPAAMVAHVKYGQTKGVGGYTIFRLGIPGVDDRPLIDALTTPNAENEWAPPFITATASPFSSVDLICGMEIAEEIPATNGQSSVGKISSDSSTVLTFSLTVAFLLRGILLR
eukprot:CAMPEP_0119009108 /NCGR_PEP_ID=MMETSP1176-20130426/4143_1 /TAXON_ID=265551 /ORGANISM="Synedropsis recta cf, Strain CCMP1620" /LENGTH=404 /DNA_ID=CAMNT_0006961561 /DNA_START=51 /DNA_END=1265 /DNA_ORIENTATION=-